MTTILLGATGRLGSILTGFATSSGADWRSVARRGGADVIWSGGFNDPTADRVFERGCTIVNMVGQTSGDAREMHLGNVDFVAELLERSAQAGIAHVVLASSAACYGAGDGTVFSEESQLCPLTPYGESKAAMERFAIDFSERRDSPAITIARIGNVAGADALIAAAKRHVGEGTPLRLHRFADGSAPLRSYIGPRDFFRVMRRLAALHDGPVRIVNVAHPQPVTLDAVLRGYRTHVMPALTWTDVEAPASVIPRAVLSTRRMHTHITLPDHADPADDLAQQVAEYLAL